MEYLVKLCTELGKTSRDSDSFHRNLAFLLMLMGTIGLDAN